ncbi:hypothetical protein F0562_019240 [Nyssa sinensis]|uniref:Uncharacterized protein n=1 Tax=Nyssa sinensis TaxID=561372 RepID=A0A5J4ZFF1_9ASTE|nr:hypothetical protein F0562_019240 [Nyssa sinensis]
MSRIFRPEKEMKMSIWIARASDTEYVRDRDEREGKEQNKAAEEASSLYGYKHEVGKGGAGDEQCAVEVGGDRVMIDGRDVTRFSSKLRLQRKKISDLYHPLGQPNLLKLGKMTAAS